MGRWLGYTVGGGWLGHTGTVRSMVGGAPALTGHRSLRSLCPSHPVKRRHRCEQDRIDLGKLQASHPSRSRNDYDLAAFGAGRFELLDRAAGRPAVFGHEYPSGKVRMCRRFSSTETILARQ